MRSILFRSEPGNEDRLLGDLWEQGTAGLIEESIGLRAFFDESVSLAGILAHHSELILEVRDEQVQDWGLLSRENWDPVFAGQYFFIVPPWLNTPAPAGHIKLVIDSVNAFGTGRHESTQLAIEALEICDPAGKSVLDVGCGSGILSRAAQALGASLVCACDIDPAALNETAGKHQITAFQGSVQAVRNRSFDLILANISAAALDALSSELRRVCKPGGRLVIAGFLTANPPQKFHLCQSLEKNEWACWICEP